MPRIEPNISVGVVGAGTMGSGIAQVALQAGHPVRLYDVVQGAAARGADMIRARLARLVEKGTLDPTAGAEAEARLAVVPESEGLAGLAGCGLVVEAAAEDLEIKRAVFRGLEAVVAPDAVLATNTSTISVTAIAAGLEHPERVCGMHFFNPAPLMKLVEVPVASTTAEQVAALVLETARAWGKTPVRCTSTPGFVANRVARPFYGEAFAVLEAGAADAATIDAVLREAGGFPMGAFELADLVGNDVDFAVGLSVWEQTYADPRYAPSVAHRGLVDAGRFGRKSGQGWYDYAEPLARGERPGPAPSTAEPRTPPESATYHGGFVTCHGLLDRIAAGGVALQRYDTGPSNRRSGDDERSAESAYGIELPSGGLVLESTGDPATYDGDAVALDWVYDAGAATRVCLAPSDTCEPATLDGAIGLFQAAGLAVSVIDDVPGLVVARTVAMLINEAVELVTRGEASAEDVDIAMRLGTGYPLGPLAWGDRIGAGVVVETLDALVRAYPSGRYRPAPLLVRARQTGRRLSATG